MKTYIDVHNVSESTQMDKNSEIINTDDNAIIHNVSKQIDTLNDETLNNQKDKIIQYFTTNNINDITFKDMKRKQFMDISDYCGNKKLKPSLGKLFKALTDEKPKRSSKVAFASNIIKSFSPQQGPQVIDENKTDEEYKNSSKEKHKIGDNKQEEKDIDTVYNQDNQQNQSDDSDDTDDEHDYTDCDEPRYIEEQMPTYINRAIWFRSDDENLERLIDQSVKQALKLKEWNMCEFVNKIYNEKFEDNVDVVWKKNFHFFNKFVEKTFERELLLEAMKQEAKNEGKTEIDIEREVKKDIEREVEKETHEMKENKETHVVFYHRDDENNTLREYNEDINDELNRTSLYENSIQLEQEQRECGYHIYTMDTAPNIAARSISYGKEEVTQLSVRNDISSDFEWAVWKKKTKGTVFQAAKNNRHHTFGYWEILNRENVRKIDLSTKSKGVPLAHLNTIFELLRVYYTKRLIMINKAADLTKSQALLGLQELDDDPLRDTYCTKFFETKPANINIYIHEQDGENGKHKKIHYQLTWWNCKKRTECNAFAIKNVSAYSREKRIEDMKSKYYMRFNASSLKDTDKDTDKDENYDEGIWWYWYDNDHADYREFSDYETVDTQKKGLLHKQIEATYQGNIDSNYPWQLFDIWKNDDEKSNVEKRLIHSFNGAQLTHLKPALISHIGKNNVSTEGYLVRYTRLSFRTAGKEKKEDTDEEGDEKDETASKVKKKRHSRQFSRQVTDYDEEAVDVNLILNMEQIAVSQTKGLFPRNLKRMNDGKDSLDDQYSGSAPFVNAWVEKYFLATEAQQKYFWSYILCICAKIKQMDIEIENQLVTIPTNKYQSRPSESLFSQTEVAQEQQDALLYKGFLVPPVLGEAITDEINNNASIDDIRDRIEKLSKTRILTKAVVDEQWLVHEDDEDIIYFHTKKKEQYLEREATMFRFAEIVRKFVIEDNYLKDETSLWPYYKNYAHKQDYGIYHTLVNRFNLTLMFSKTSIFQLFDENHNELMGCIEHFSCKNGNDTDDDLEDENEDDIAIRHRRKYAATLLLQKWNTLRNLNILRQQLVIIFGSIIDEGGKTAKYDEEKKEFVIEEGPGQKDMIKKAQSFDGNKKWDEEIKKINKEIKELINSKHLGWQYLSEYDLKNNETMEISIKQYPLFESFCKRFLFETVKEDRTRLTKEIRCAPWYSQFKQSWVSAPKWWSTQHDTILLELALKHNIDHMEYITELNGEKAFDFRMRLKDQADYLEFQHFCEQLANVLHRLKYITNKLILKLNKIKPSLIEIRIPEAKDRPKFTSESLIFNEYERDKHKQYVEREMKLASVENYTTEYTLRAMKTSRGKTAINNNKNNNNNSPRKSKRRRHQKWHENASVISMDLAKNY
eukprot:230265_1